VGMEKQSVGKKKREASALRHYLKVASIVELRERREQASIVSSPLMKKATWSGKRESNSSGSIES